MPGSTGQCDASTGQCRCRPNVRSFLCSECSANTYNYSSAGCADCSCDPVGSISIGCDSVSRRSVRNYPFLGGRSRRRGGRGLSRTGSGDCSVVIIIVPFPPPPARKPYDLPTAFTDIRSLVSVYVNFMSPAGNAIFAKMIIGT